MNMYFSQLKTKQLKNTISEIDNSIPIPKVMAM